MPEKVGYDNTATTPGAGPSRQDWRLKGRTRNPMAGRGETLKMFVVQRTFRTVRKGYDPDEVDRHLELVSRWFTQTDAAKALREERERIEERERAAAEQEARAERSLEGVRREAEATIEGAQRRAAADERAAAEDRERAAEELRAAREEAARIQA